jgi:tetratricopeptide (TPR) repeat protein
MAIVFRLAFSLLVIFSIHQSAQAGGARSVDDYADKRARTALVIGFAAYPTAPLKNPVADAALVAKHLLAAGFKVDHLVDVPARQLGAAIAEFKQSSKGADISLIYYAGHGLQVDSENYIVPTDFDPNGADPLAGLYPLRALLEGLDTIAKARVVLLDACRDNPFGEALKARGARVSGEGLAPIELPVDDGGRWPQGTSGLLVGYATQPSKTASDGIGSNGPYAAGLASALATPDADFESILKRTTGAVRAETGGEQHPEYRSALTGPLYLVSRPKPLECDLLAVDTDNDVSLTGVVLEEIDAARAIPACEAALQRQPGSPRIMHNLGRALEKAGRSQEALDIYHRAALLGFDPAQLYYGNSLMEGLGGEINMKEGLQWLRRAYEQGNRQAMINYAEYDLSPIFERSDRVKVLQDALRKAGHSAPDNGVMDEATKAALQSFVGASGIEGQRITFQVLERLGIVETLFPKRRIDTQRQ